MKLDLPCPFCAALSRNNLTPDIQIVETELRDDGAYMCECPRGHPFVATLLHQHFEMLFELGINAAIDGYYREAVSNFAAALERFYEFSLHVFIIASAISEEEWNAAWNIVKNMSERQLGAYIFMHLALVNKPAQLLGTKQIEFRNDVVHKGKIPTLENAIKFGEVIRNIIIQGSIDLNGKFNDEMNAAMMRRRILPRGAMAGMITSDMTYLTVLNFNATERSELDQIPLIDIIKTRKAERQT